MKLINIEKQAVLDCDLSFESFYKNEFTYRGSCTVEGNVFDIVMRMTPKYRTTMEATEKVSNFSNWCPEDVYLTVNGKNFRCEDLI